MATHVTMEQLVHELNEFARSGFAPDQVQDYLGRTRIEDGSLAQYMSFRKDRYTRHLIAKNPAFELLVICWNKGHKAPIHGHEGERCWARVERGTLRFSSYRVEQQDPLRLVEIERLDAGVGHLDGPADVHSVENVEEFDAPAASLHVYSKPFEACDIYDLGSSCVRRVQLTYDTLFGKPAPSSPNA